MLEVKTTNFSLQDAVKKTKHDHAEERFTTWEMSHAVNSN